MRACRDLIAMVKEYKYFQDGSVWDQVVKAAEKEIVGTGSSPVHDIVMAQELFNALSMLLNCQGDYSHINCGSFDLLTDGESYDNAVDVLKKYHDILSP